MVNSAVICFTVYVASEGAEGGARFSRGVQFMDVRRGLSDYGLVSIPNHYQILDIHKVMSHLQSGFEISKKLTSRFELLQTKRTLQFHTPCRIPGIKDERWLKERYIVSIHLQCLVAVSA